VAVAVRGSLHQRDVQCISRPHRQHDWADGPRHVSRGARNPAGRLGPVRYRYGQRPGRRHL
jgi:hypothetical protein